MDRVAFDYDDANASIQGHRYPGFFHDGDRSLVMLMDGAPCSILGYSHTGQLPYVVQLQGSPEYRPPKGWELMLFERFSQEPCAHENGSLIVQSGRNNLYALEFHAFLLERGVYEEVGLGRPSFDEAVRFGSAERHRLSERFLSIPDDERIIAHLHPSLAILRYDATVRRFARSSGSRVAVLDDTLAQRFNGLVGDLLITRSSYE